MALYPTLPVLVSRSGTAARSIAARSVLWAMEEFDLNNALQRSDRLTANNHQELPFSLPHLDFDYFLDAIHLIYRIVGRQFNQIYKCYMENHFVYGGQRRSQIERRVSHNQLSAIEINFNCGKNGQSWVKSQCSILDQ